MGCTNGEPAGCDSAWNLSIDAGVIVTSKAVVSEISDDSNHAIGISMVGTAMGFGYIIGPAVAGAIADPVNQYNLTISSKQLETEPGSISMPHCSLDGLHDFLTKFPFSLPPIVSAVLFVVSAVVTLFFLPETLGVKK
jgi:MFS family permease